MSNDYPRGKYAIDPQTGLMVHCVVKDAAEDKSLPKGWVDSPLQLGIETCPSRPVLKPLSHDQQQVVADESAATARQDQAKADAK